MRQQILSRRYSAPSSDSHSYLLSPVDEYTFANFTMAHFYQYLRSSNPFVIKDGCTNWPAFTTWRDRNYLVNQTKLTQAKNFVWEKSRDITDPAVLDQHLAQMEQIKKEGLPGYDFSKGMVHMQNLWLNRNVELLKEVMVPDFIGKVLIHEDTYLSF